MMTLRFALRLITIFSLTAAALTAAERPYGVDPMQAVTLADRLEISCAAAFAQLDDVAPPATSQVPFHHQVGTHSALFGWREDAPPT